MASEEIGNLVVRIEANMQNFVDSTNKAEGFLSGLKKAALGLGAVLAGGAIFKSFIDDAAEAEANVSQLDTVLKSTKGAAGVTKDSILELASSLQKVTKFSDDQVIAGDNLLLTFTKIGKDVFPQATETMLDMSQVLGQDVKSSAIQLGKALNDPINGVTALSRVGVSFTESQKEVIKKLVETGDTVGAQKIILAELNTEFGNSARAAGETFGGKLVRLKNQLGEIKESIGGKLLPVLSSMASWFINKMPAIQDSVLNTFTEMGEVIKPIVDTVLPNLQSGFKAVKDSFNENLKGVFDFIADIKTKIQKQDWEGIGKLLGDSLRKAIENIVGIGEVIAKKVSDEMKKVDWATIGRSSVEVAVGFIAGFVAGFLDITTWVEIVKKYWEPLLEAVIGIILLPESWITKIVGGLAKIPFVGKIIAWFVEHISSLGKSAFAPIKKVIGDFADELWKGFMKAIGKGEGVGIGQAIKNVVGKGIAWIKGLGEDLYLKGLEMMNNLGKSIAEHGPKQVVQKFRELSAKIGSVITEYVPKIVEMGKDIVTGLWNGIGSMAAWIKTKVTGFVTSIGTTIKDFFGISSPSKLMIEYGKYIAEGLAEGIKNNTEKVKNSANIMAQAIVDAVGRIKENLSVAVDIAQAKFDLLKAKMGETTDKAKLYDAELIMLNTQMAAHNEKISVLTKAYEDMKKAKGEAATETQKLYLELLQEQTAQQNLAKQIAETNRVQQQRALTTKDIDWSNPLDVTSKYIQIAMQNAFASGQTVGSTGNSFTVGGANIGTIPKFAKGTDYVARDTLAYVHKGEAVIPANKNTSGQSVVNNFQIDKLNVRNDQDAKLVAKELYNLQTSRARASGIVYA